MSQAKELNLLEGSLWDKMIIIALPLAFTGVLQQLFNAADVAVLGHYVSSDAMAGRGKQCPGDRPHRESVYGACARR